MGEIDLCGGIGHLVHHQHTGVDVDGTAHAVHSGHHAGRGHYILGKIALIGNPDCFLNCCIQHIHTDVFFMRQSFHSLDDF